MIYLSKQLGTWTFVHQLIVFYGQFFYFLKGACSLQTNKGHEKYSKSKQTNVKHVDWSFLEMRLTELISSVHFNRY